MRKIRVLIVDDSVVIRRLLSDLLREEPTIEVLGAAPNGRIALAKVAQLKPDLVTLDIEMPEMDGLETLTELRKSYPILPVIMFSTLTERGAVATIEALSRGASSYVAKPSNSGSFPAAMQSVREQLIPKIKALCPLDQPAVSTSSISSSLPLAASPGGPTRKAEIVVIGCSTGGPQALEVVLKSLSRDFPVPILVVQHMPAVFTTYLASRLNQECPMEVREAADGELLEAGKVLIAPGDYHLEIARQGASMVTVLQQQPPENSCRPSVDVLFRSAAKHYGSGCLAVVLTGMGHDGLRGAQQIFQAQGTILAQDQATSVVWGMPRAVAEARIVSAILPVREFGRELQRRAAMGRRFSIASS